MCERGPINGTYVQHFIYDDESINKVNLSTASTQPF
jgi:hypothetical protein